ncbi:MAG: PIN domain-containing protein [Chloroflexi bacterium]|nr:PIN domain-containing protein [Chloroflexota bacterium]
MIGALVIACVPSCGRHPPHETREARAALVHRNRLRLLRERPARRLHACHTSSCAGRIRRGSSLRLPDALIAATALQHRLTLVTRNVRDFNGVKGLKLRSPE